MLIVKRQNVNKVINLEYPDRRTTAKGVRASKYVTKLWIHDSI